MWCARWWNLLRVSSVCGLMKRRMSTAKPQSLEKHTTAEFGLDTLNERSEQLEQ
jgi:hypothetical protein